jgi:glutaredoxin
MCIRSTTLPASRKSFTDPVFRVPLYCSYCPYCTKAKETLTKEGAKFEVVELDKRKDGDAIQLALFKLTGACACLDVDAAEST